MLAPDFREVPQILLGFFQRDSGIDFFQVGDYAFEILVADIFRGTADLMDDAALQPAGLSLIKKTAHFLRGRIYPSVFVRCFLRFQPVCFQFCRKKMGCLN